MTPELEIMISQGTVKLIEASKLSMDDEFMQYEPITEKEKLFKKRLQVTIEKGVQDFYLPVYDASFDSTMKIVFVAGNKPVLQKTFTWWEKTAKEIGGHIATRSEYIAFLGVIIKLLIAEGKTIAEAWNEICNNSSHQQNEESDDDSSTETKKPIEYVYEAEYEKGLSPEEKEKIGQKRKGLIEFIRKTGAYKMAGFFDFKNTYKLLKEDEDKSGGFIIASGITGQKGTNFAIADLGKCFDDKYKFYDSVGLVVFN